jgi:hypothetical protein
MLTRLVERFGDDERMTGPTKNGFLAMGSGWLIWVAGIRSSFVWCLYMVCCVLCVVFCVFCVLMWCADVRNCVTGSVVYCVLFVVMLWMC